MTITSVTHPTAVEGQAISGAVVAHFTDADPNGTVGDYTATITWADGQTSPGTVVVNDGGFDVLGSHTYLEEIITAAELYGERQRRGRGERSGTITTATVADAALGAGALTPPAATEGIAFTNTPVFHFTDADPNGTAADYTAVVQLGDGNSVTLSSVTGANGQIVASGDGYDVQLSYTYAEEIQATANATFSVSVSDAGGASTLPVTSHITVADAALTITSVTHPTAVEGQAINGAVVAHFTDADPNGDSRRLHGDDHLGGRANVRRHGGAQ